MDLGSSVIVSSIVSIVSSIVSIGMVDVMDARTRVRKGPRGHGHGGQDQRPRLVLLRRGVGFPNGGWP